MQKDGYGTFGAQASLYSAGRRKFPHEIILRLKGIIGQGANVLDLGCGTGISSRQIAKQGFGVTGIDADERMIRQAVLDSKGHNIPYLVSSAGCLPYGDQTFDVVTAFSSFHWFCDEVTLAEIKRVLVPHGLLFVVNRNHTGEVDSIIKSTLKNFIVGQEPQSSKSDYGPAKIMEKGGFRYVATYIWQTVDRYTTEELLAYVQTMSMWNLVPKNRRTGALKALKRLVFKGEGSVLYYGEVRAVYGFWHL